MKILKPLQFFFKIKVQKQLYIIYLLAMIIPVIFIGGYMVYHARSLLMEHYKDQAYSDNLRVKSLLLDLTSNVYDRSLSLAKNKKLVSLLSNEAGSSDKISPLTRYSEIYSLLSQDASISTVDIYTWNKSLPDGKYYHLISDSDIPEVKRAVSSPAPFWSVTSTAAAGNNPKKVLCLYTRIFLPKINSYAVLSLTVSDNHLKNRIENSNLNTVIKLNSGDICYNTDGNPANDVLTSSLPEKGGRFLGKMKADGYKAVGCVSTLLPSYSSDTFYIASLDYEAYPRINEITATYIAILMLVILLAATFIYIYSAYFSKRVNTLRESMHAASLGNYDIADTFTGEDEISQVFTDLNIMLKGILKKETEAYESRLKVKELANEQQKMEFKMLTSQINPHFLYNTLETIRMRSLKAGNTEVANAVKLLGKSMRYVLENTITDFTSLKKELDYIETYLSIQKLRFHDKVNYTLKVPEEPALSEYRILPLLLQPIVENAILHGLREVEENGRIIIRIKESGKNLFITVYDNGCGMSPEELSAMRDNIFHHPKESYKSIGLTNIYQRIKLCYGDEYGLQVHSDINRGTIVTVIIPARSKEGEAI